MELKLQNLNQEEMQNISGGKGKKKSPSKKRDWESIIDYGVEAGKWIYKNAGSAGKIDARYKHGAPGRKF
ncbi:MULTISPECIES: hypothetical protein [Bacillus]|uniref:Bacteriocin n=2 Tax=Bacillus thuringiensis TaxID=1428 RepID=A0A0B5NBB5_BACTU|nr:MULTISPECIES: hypothetical protein [Bacillus]AJG73675.1 hypothetical protein BF38_6168 [Bacillus thuringiensis]MCQ0952724.1 hypothetical protein [Bacillus cereus]MDV6367424.1 hypothetical protein [Bacillus cereus]OPA02034.1 hypothetical protein BHL27_06665 [Bacillus cereus]OTX59445.1 hypothetical protein BK723_04530 [Bacillus thuringiensis serovar pondicheriensis]